MSLSPPDAFTCPHRFQCWQRELSRVLVMIVIAATVRYFPQGCAALKVEGPGVTVTATPVWPSVKQIEAANPQVPGTRPAPIADAKP